MNRLELPADLTRSYKIYKKYTALVTKWLIDNGWPTLRRQEDQQRQQTRRSGKKARSKAKKAPPPENTPKQVSTQELLKLADAVVAEWGNTKAEGLGAPEYVYQALQAAIDMRKKVTSFFMMKASEAVEQNDAHIYFTNSLQEIFVKLGGHRWEENCRNLPATLPSIAEALVQKSPRSGINEESAPHEDTSGLFSNKFTALGKALDDLGIADELEGDGEVDEVQRAVASEQTASTEIKEPRIFEGLEEYGVSEDELFQWCRHWLYIRTLDLIFEEVISYWTEASSNSKTFSLSKMMVLSWLTNAGFEGAIREIGRVVAAEPIFVEHVNLMKEVLRIRNFGNDGPPGAFVEDWNGEFSEGPGLLFPWIDLQAMHNLNLGSDPSSNIRPTKMMADAMKELFKTLLEKKEQERVPFCTRMYPLVIMFKEFMEQTPNPRSGEPSFETDTALVFGLHLLGAIPTIASRKEYSRMSTSFARLIRENLELSVSDEGVNCVCASCGGPALHIMMMDFKSNLDRYISEGSTEPNNTTKFNQYLDNAWTVGANAIELLSWATDVGLRLCSRNSYLSTVLHLYNMLRQLGVLAEEEKIPIFDGLCFFLCEKIFLTTDPPRQNFRSCFLRSAGARLRPGDHKVLRHIHQRPTEPPNAAEMRAGRRSHRLHPGSSTGQDMWSLKSPSPDEEYAARLVPSNLSLFYGMDNQKYAMNMGQWAHVYSMAERGGSGSEPLRKFWRHQPRPDTLKDKGLLEQVVNDPFPHLLQKLKAAVSQEFDMPLRTPTSNPSASPASAGTAPISPPPFPCALVNYFKMFTASTKILRTAVILSSITAGLTAVDGRSKSAKSGRMWAETLFEFVDIHMKEGLISMNGNRNGELVRVFPQLRCARDAVLRIMKGKLLEEFLWEI